MHSSPVAAAADADSLASAPFPEGRESAAALAQSCCVSLTAASVWDARRAHVTDRESKSVHLRPKAEGEIQEVLSLKQRVSLSPAQPLLPRSISCAPAAAAGPVTRGNGCSSSSRSSRIGSSWRRRQGKARGERERSRRVDGASGRSCLDSRGVGRQASGAGGEVERERSDCV